MTNPKPTAEMNKKIIEKRISEILERHGVHPIDAFNSTPDLITLLASEVDRVIKERMPSEDEKSKATDAYCTRHNTEYDYEKANHFEAGWNAFRNRIKGKQ